MAEPTKFQKMTGCSACKHAAPADPAGTSAAALGKAYWCPKLAKAVDARDGCECQHWEA